MAPSALIGVFLVIVVTIQLSNGWFIPRWSSQCYEDPPIGCFPVSHPYNNTGGIAPQSPGRQRIRFNLLRAGRSGREFSHRNSDQVLQRHFNSSAKTTVIIHGFFESASVEWVLEMAAELLYKDDQMNVITVDWRRGAHSFVYPQAVANTRVVGAVLATVLEDMIALGADPSRFHLIGFSLGAHVAGYAGERLPGIGRITGLDPAAPGFKDTPPSVRLDPDDAIVVDVYHTDSNPVTGTGLEEPIGTVDFYLNQGMEQPGCAHNVLDRLVAAFRQGLGTTAWRDAVICSHSRAFLFFTSTINNNCNFRVKSCPTQSSLYRGGCRSCRGQVGCPTPGYGFEAVDEDTRTGRRIFDVVTTGSWPYCEEESAPILS